MESESRSILLDVGVWSSLDDTSHPKMTFGLLQHDAIALCTYFSDGTCCKFPISCEVGEGKRKEKYEFKGSLINEFLTTMMTKKYPNFSPKSDIKNCGYHIIKLIPFPPTSLLDERNKLVILIPDLHLHYFKDTYLDNFVTYWENEWDSSKEPPEPKLVPLGQRRSMETEFGFFLQSIIDFQQVGGRNFETEVIVLGDTYEMWETHFMLHLFYIPFKKYLQKFEPDDIFEDWNEFRAWLKRTTVKYRILEWFRPRIYVILPILHYLIPKDWKRTLPTVKRILRIKIGELPFDPEFVKQVVKLNENDEFILRYMSPYVKPMEKAEALASEILKKHHGKIVDEDGKIVKVKSFEELFRMIDEVKPIRWLRGNHDNFLFLPDLSPLHLFFDSYKCPFDRFDLDILRSPEGTKRANIIYEHSSRNTHILYEHGHALDYSNNNYACGLGYLLTAINALYEGKKRADRLKLLVELASHSRYDYAYKVFKHWEEKEKMYSLGPRPWRNKILVQGHTHSRFLKDITDDYKKWREKQPKTTVQRRSRPQSSCMVSIFGAIAAWAKSELSPG